MSASALLTLARVLHGASSLEDVVDAVQAALLESTRYRWLYLHLKNPDGRTFDIVGRVPTSDDVLRQQLSTIDVSRDALLQYLATMTTPLLVEDLRNDPLADQAQVEFFGNRTSFAVPMFERDERIGPLVVATFRDQGVLVPTEAEREFIIQIASLVSVVIVRLRAEEAKQRLEVAASNNRRVQALGVMAGEVAHDFNNLLTVIVANLELAGDELAGHPARQFLDEAAQAAERGAQVTQQLLAFARGQILETTDFDPQELLRKVGHRARPVIPDTITLDLNLSDVPGEVTGDAGQLERVFLNLVLNARDAILGADAHGSITVDSEWVQVNGQYVALEDELTSGEYLVVSVTDTGVGIERSVQARIFEPFFSTKSQRGGTGLGLSVVDGIVRQHGGHVHVYSEPGVGTTFRVYLPCSTPQPRSEFLSAPPQHQARRDDTVVGRAVLVVDDDPPVLKAIRQILERAGYTVFSAANEEDALGILEATAIDVLLTDVVLRCGDGLALARQARQLRPKLPVLFMTGYARGRLSDGHMRHLRKPFSAEALLRELESTCGASPGAFDE